MMGLIRAAQATGVLRAGDPAHVGTVGFPFGAIGLAPPPPPP
jgi:hypothetical protein